MCLKGFAWRSLCITAATITRTAVLILILMANVYCCDLCNLRDRISVKCIPNTFACTHLAAQRTASTATLCLPIVRSAALDFDANLSAPNVQTQTNVRSCGEKVKTSTTHTHTHTAPSKETASWRARTGEQQEKSIRKTFTSHTSRLCGVVTRNRYD